MSKQKVLITGASAGFGSTENGEVEVRSVQKLES
jgi:NADP-dependent 3-hydroxy acid dehydrogenase YdfG